MLGDTNQIPNVPFSSPTAKTFSLGDEAKDVTIDFERIGSKVSIQFLFSEIMSIRLESGDRNKTAMCQDGMLVFPVGSHSHCISTKRKFRSRTNLSHSWLFNSPRGHDARITVESAF